MEVACASTQYAVLRCLIRGLLLFSVASRTVELTEGGNDFAPLLNQLGNKADKVTGKEVKKNRKLGAARNHPLNDKKTSENRG
jgi:hypothetical protein